MSLVSRVTLKRHRRGHTVIEIIAVFGVLMILMGILLPAVGKVREAARQLACRNNLRQLGIGSQIHESARGKFPLTRARYFKQQWSGRRLVGAVSPLQQIAVYSDPGIGGRIPLHDDSGPGFDGPPASSNSVVEELLKTDIPVFHCPSDIWLSGSSNYRANMGTGTGVFIRTDSSPWRDPGNGNGAFIHDKPLSSKDFSDGLSNTCFFGERLIGDGDPSRYRPWCDAAIVAGDIRSLEEARRKCSSLPSGEHQHHSYLGYSWYWGGWFDAWYNHVLEPNSKVPDCNAGSATLGGGSGAYSARSYHTVGANFLFADGSCRLIGANIDDLAYQRLGSRNDGSE